jgi:glutamate 5-kinase
MIDPVRQEVITQASSVVIKVGTNVLAGEDGRIDHGRLHNLCEQVHRVHKSGRKVTLVSSGAIGAGIGRLGLGKRPTDLRHLQACAAVGQCSLMRLYEECFNQHGIRTAQLLLTAGDFDNRTRYLNARNTILTLLEWDCLPIINENDTVSIAEIRFGDNDKLAAMVTNLLQSPLLILLTVVDGLFSADPNTDPNARLLTTVPNLDHQVLEMAGSSRSSLGTGGMRSKLRAARIATAAGESVIMANGAKAGILDAIIAGEPVGTLFLPHGSSMPAWKRWLGFTAQPKGQLIVDAGARDAVQRRGRSLLPIGVVRVGGSFHKGDVVVLCDSEGTEFARGLSNYSAADATRICGMRTEQIGEVLGALPYEEIIHRDNLVVII